MNIENHKIIFPRGSEESRRVTDSILEELSMFAITDTGRFEGVGAHDDLVMGLALANAATHQLMDNFILLDDIDIFGTKEQKPINSIGGGVLGLNF